MSLYYEKILHIHLTKKNSSHEYYIVVFDYYDEKSFCEKNMKVLNLSIDQLSLCHLNIRSMQANLSSFSLYLELLSFDFIFIGITETWLTKDSCSLYAINDYEFIDNHRETKSGGGVGLFIHKKVHFTDRQDLNVMDWIVLSALQLKLIDLFLIPSQIL